MLIIQLALIQLLGMEEAFRGEKWQVGFILQ